MNASEFKVALEGLTNGKELYEYYVNAVETEKQRGISEVRDRNKEAENLRRYKIALEKLGFDKGSEELDTYIEGLRESKDKAKDVDDAKVSLKSLNSELTELRKKFDVSQNELSSERKAKEAIALENKRKSIKLKLNEALKDKVYGHDFVADSLINDGKVDLEQDNVVFKDGENKVAFEDGIKKLLEQRTDILKNVQKGGADSRPATNNNSKKFSIEQIEKMSREDIAANLTDIKTSLGIKV
jgi:hypothetical protein